MTVTTASPAAPRAPGLRYRGHLDGVRSVAVYLVLAFHCGLGVMTGGFIGVDVFFVLSGYLVTRLIMAELSAGVFKLSAFYSRRVRRLLPAALLVLVATTITWLLIASRSDRALLVDDIRWIAGYAGNWHFAANSTDYFHSEGPTSPVLHYWSLSVEEQFYVLWPVIVMGAWWLAKRNRISPRLVVGLTALLLGLQSWIALRDTYVNGVEGYPYFGTGTRAYQLLAGAVLAAWMHGRLSGTVNRFAWWIGPLALGGVAILGTQAAHVEVYTRSQLVVVATVLLLWSIESDEQSPLAHFLAWEPLRRLGLISYGTYLWHFPLIVALQRIYPSLTPLELFGIVLPGATVVAALSFALLERPVRRARRLTPIPRLVTSTGVVMSLTLGLVAIPPVLHSHVVPLIHDATAVVDPEHKITPLDGVDITALTKAKLGTPGSFPLPPDLTCMTQADKCVLWHGKPGAPKVLLLGDSHARMLSPTFRTIAAREGFTLMLAAATACPWQRQLVFANSNQNDCRKAHDFFYNTLIPQYNPDIIILATRASDHVIGRSYKVASIVGSIKSKSSSVMISLATKASLQALAAPKRTLIVVEPVPVSPISEESCLTESHYAEQCLFRADVLPSPAELSMRQDAVDMPGVRTMNLDPLTCPRLPVCDPIVNGAVVREDHDHLTPRFAASIAPAVEAMFDADVRGRR